MLEICDKTLGVRIVMIIIKKTQVKIKNSACDLRKCCVRCGAFITQNSMNVKNGCFMRPLYNETASGESVLYLFYDFETTQDTYLHDKASVYVLNSNVCGRSVPIARIYRILMRTVFSAAKANTFWDDPVRDMLSYVCESRTCVGRIIVIAHNAKNFEH